MSRSNIPEVGKVRPGTFFWDRQDGASASKEIDWLRPTHPAQEMVSEMYKEHCLSVMERGDPETLGIAYRNWLEQRLAFLRRKPFDDDLSLVTIGKTEGLFTASDDRLSALPESARIYKAKVWEYVVALQEELIRTMKAQEPGLRNQREWAMSVPQWW